VESISQAGLIKTFHNGALGVLPFATFCGKITLAWSCPQAGLTFNWRKLDASLGIMIQNPM
jgi:hypothetical protein